MKYTLLREGVPTLLPITKVVLELNLSEAHDLKVLVNAGGADLHEPFLAGCRALNATTRDRDGLIKELRAALEEVK